MKTKISAITALLLMGVTSLVAQNDGIPVTFTERDSGERDTVRAGEAFARVFWDSYEIEISYYDPNTRDFRYMVAEANLDRRITSVVSDGEELLKSGETLPGIPIPEGGMQYTYVYVNGVRDGQPMVHGNARLETIDQSNPLTVVLHPVNKTKIIEYDISGLPDGVDPYGLRLISENGDWVGYWYGWLGGFVLWIDPSISPIYVTVIDNDGNRYDSFLIDPREDPQPVQAASVNFTLAGKVHRFIFDEEERYPQAELIAPLDGLAEINEITPDGEYKQTVAARSFIYENVKDRDLRFRVYGDVDDERGWIRVTSYAVTPNGLEMIEQREEQADDKIEDGRFEIGSSVGAFGYTKLLFVVEMVVGNPVDDFYFSLGVGKG